jgi:hypothetical protein
MAPAAKEPANREMTSARLLPSMRETADVGKRSSNGVLPLGPRFDYE